MTQTDRQRHEYTFIKIHDTNTGTGIPPIDIRKHRHGQSQRNKTHKSPHIWPRGKGVAREARTSDTDHQSSLLFRARHHASTTRAKRTRSPSWGCPIQTPCTQSATTHRQGLRACGIEAGSVTWGHQEVACSTLVRMWRPIAVELAHIRSG